MGRYARMYGAATHFCRVKLIKSTFSWNGCQNASLVFCECVCDVRASSPTRFPCRG